MLKAADYTERRLLNFVMDNPSLCVALLTLLDAQVTPEFYEEFTEARRRWRREQAAEAGRD